MNTLYCATKTCYHFVLCLITCADTSNLLRPLLISCLYLFWLVEFCVCVFNLISCVCVNKQLMFWFIRYINLVSNLCFRLIRRIIFEIINFYFMKTVNIPMYGNTAVYIKHWAVCQKIDYTLRCLEYICSVSSPLNIKTPRTLAMLAITYLVSDLFFRQIRSPYSECLFHEDSEYIGIWIYYGVWICS